MAVDELIIFKDFSHFEYVYAFTTRKQSKNEFDTQ